MYFYSICNYLDSFPVLISKPLDYIVLEWKAYLIEIINQMEIRSKYKYRDKLTIIVTFRIKFERQSYKMMQLIALLATFGILQVSVS